MWLDIQGVSGNKKTVESPSYFCFWDHEHYLCMAEKGEMFFYFFFRICQDELASKPRGED